MTWAIQSVRARRTELFSRLPEYGVIAGSYRNVDPRCDVYDHADHRAVHLAIHNTDRGTPGSQWGRTCIDDPEVAQGRVNDVDKDVYQYAIGVRAPRIDPVAYPAAYRTGAFQVSYGGLAATYRRADPGLAGANARENSSTLDRMPSW